MILMFILHIFYWVDADMNHGNVSSEPLNQDARFAKKMFKYTVILAKHASIITEQQSMRLMDILCTS